MPDVRPGMFVPRSAWRAVAIPAAALAAGVAALAVGLQASGYDAAAALGAMWQGAFGSPYAVFSATLVRAIPLITIGLGIALAFRAGAFNIGAEGQFLAGAVAATWAGLQVAGWPSGAAVAAVLLAGVVAGAAWVALPAWLRVRFGVLEVISTIILNFVAESMVSLMVQGPLQEARGTYPQSDTIVNGARLPLIGSSRLHLGIALALLAAGALWLVFRRTLWGFQLRAAGANPRAAEVSGRVNVGRMIAVSLLLSGALAGLAGAMEVGGVTYALFQNLSPGYGFTAIAVALLARLNPLGVVVSGVLFAGLETGGAAMQREAGVPAVAVYVTEAVVILVVLVASALGRRSLVSLDPEPDAAG